MGFNFETSFKLVIYLIDTKISRRARGSAMNTELKLMSKSHTDEFAVRGRVQTIYTQLHYYI